MRVYQLARELVLPNGREAPPWVVRFALGRMGIQALCDLSLVETSTAEQLRNGGFRNVLKAASASAPVTSGTDTDFVEFVKGQPSSSNVPLKSFTIAADHYANARWIEANVLYRHALEDVLRRMAESVQRASLPDDVEFATLLREHLQRTKVFTANECSLVRGTYSFLSAAAHKPIAEQSARLAHEVVPAVCCFLVEKFIVWEAARTRRSSK